MSRTGRNLRRRQVDIEIEQQASNPHLMSNPVALMSRMEVELNDIRRLALYRGRNYQSAIRRLNCLEETLLAMFEVRLQLMENIILRPRFVAASQSLVPALQGNSPTAGMRDLQENLFLLKNRVHLLQRRVNNLNAPQSRRSSVPGSHRVDRDVPDNTADSVDYADIIRRELEKISQEGTRSDENGGATLQTESRRVEQSSPNNTGSNQLHVRTKKSRSLPNKISKFTC